MRSSLPVGMANGFAVSTLLPRKGHVMTSPGKKVQASRDPGDKLEIIFYTTEQALRLLSAGKYNPMTAILAPNSDHVVWTDSDQPLVLVWMAWGEEA
jgi:hypothetical protein